MATFIPGLTDQVPTITPFTPDFGLVQKALGTLQNRYDQGFASIKNVHNSVLNAQLTNENLQLRRNAYVKAAENQLQKLSSVDLSEESNVQAAESVYAPFWQDDQILTDVGITKSYQTEMRRAMTVRDSSDEKVREQYNDISMRYLENGLNKLRTADPNSADFSRIEKRRFVPFKNLESYLNGEAAKQGLKVQWSTASGPTVTTIEGGPASVGSFKTWANNMLGNNFSEQFNVMGTVEYETKFDHLQRENPWADRASLNSLLAAQVIEESNKQYLDRAKTYTRDLKNLQDKIDAYPDDVTREQATKIAQLKLQYDSIKTQSDAHLDEYSKFAGNVGKTLNDIAANPTGYYANINRGRTVDGWANAKAAGTHTQSIALNQVWNAEMDLWAKKEDIKIRQEANEINRLEAQNKQAARAAALSRPGGNAGKVKFDENGNVIEAPGEPDSNHGHYVGPASTDVTQVTEAYNRFQERQVERVETANAGIFNLEGMGGQLRKLGNFSSEQIRDWMESVQNSLANPKQTIPVERNEIMEALEAKTGMKITGPFSAREAIIKYTAENLMEKMQPGGAGLTRDDVKLFIDYMGSKKALDEYNYLESERKQKVQEYIAKDPTRFKGWVKTGVDGKLDLKDASEVAKDFPALKLKMNGGAKEISITPQEFAEMHMNGTLGVDASNNIFFTEGENKSKTWVVKEINGKPQEFWDKNLNLLYSNGDDDLGTSRNPNSIVAKYGKSGELKQLKEELNKSVVPNLPEYQNQTSKMGAVYGFNLTKEDGEKGYLIANEVGQAYNHDNIYIGNEKSNNSEVNAAVLKIMNMNESDFEKHVSKPYYVTSGVTGKPALRLQFGVFDGKGQIDGYAAKELSGKTVDIEINPNAKAPNLQSMRTSSGYYIYGSLLRGKAMVSDELMKQVGFDFTITPNKSNNPDGAFVEIKSKKIDPKTRQLIDDKPASTTIYFNRTNPDELVNYIYDLYQKRMVENQTAIQVYDTNLKANPEMLKKSDVLKTS